MKLNKKRGRPKKDRTLDKQISIPTDHEEREVFRKAAEREGMTLAGWIRHLIYKEIHKRKSNKNV